MDVVNKGRYEKKDFSYKFTNAFITIFVLYIKSQFTTLVSLPIVSAHSHGIIKNLSQFI